jgi:hypothetical protein
MSTIVWCSRNAVLVAEDPDEVSHLIAVASRGGNVVKLSELPVRAQEDGPLGKGRRNGPAWRAGDAITGREGPVYLNAQHISSFYERPPSSQ